MSRIVSTTGQEVPGGASRIAIPVRGRCFFTARMSGGEIAWPMRRRPWTNCTAPAAPHSTSPIARGTSRMAPSGHTRAAAAAAVAQVGKGQHGAPQARDGAVLAEFATAPAVACTLPRPPRERGSSRSRGWRSPASGRCGRWAPPRRSPGRQRDRSWSARITARFVATIVLPVPPLPLAMAIRMSASCFWSPATRRGRHT